MSAALIIYNIVGSAERLGTVWVAFSMFAL